MPARPGKLCSTFTPTGAHYYTTRTYPEPPRSLLLLEDSAETQENEVKYHNKGSKVQGKPLLQPLYNVEDARHSFQFFEARPYGEWFKAMEGVDCLFTDAGHIIGSACVHLRIVAHARTLEKML